MKTKLKTLLVARMRESFANDAIAYVKERFDSKLALNTGKYGICALLNITAKDDILKFRVVNIDGEQYSINCDIDAAANFGVEISKTSPNASNSLLAFAGIEQVMLQRGVTVVTAGPVTDAIFAKFGESLTAVKEEEDPESDDEQESCDCPECDPQGEQTDEDDIEDFAGFLVELMEKLANANKR